MSGGPEIRVKSLKSVRIVPVSCGTKKRKTLTQARVRELFDYREDGKLIWKSTRNNFIKPGSIAGGPTKAGYLVTSVGGEGFFNHRLVWIYHHGYSPEHDIDHIDRDKTNNRINNLREVTQSCNRRNIGNMVNNKSGVKGVFWNAPEKRWKVSIGVHGKRRHLGTFTSFIEAVCYRLAAEQCLGWEGWDSNSPAYQYVTLSLNETQRLYAEKRSNLVNTLHFFAQSIKDGNPVDQAIEELVDILMEENQL